MIRGVLIEGPDCSGKSTLVDRIKNALRWDAKSLHHKEGDQFTRYLQEYAFADQLVIDRGHISEEVYSHLWRGGSPFSDVEKEILNAIIRHNFLIIFACPDLATLEKRYLSRGYVQQIKLEELKTSRESFIAYFESFSVLVYLSKDFAELDALVAKVKEIAT